MIMEAEKAHDLPAAEWRPRQAAGVVQGPESQRAKGSLSQGYRFQYESKGLRNKCRRRLMSQIKLSGREKAV